jgi:hypothetical protein
VSRSTVQAVYANVATVIAIAMIKQDGDTASVINSVVFEDRLLIDDPSGLLLGTGDAGKALHFTLAHSPY